MDVEKESAGQWVWGALDQELQAMFENEIISNPELTRIIGILAVVADMIHIMINAAPTVYHSDVLHSDFLHNVLEKMPK